MNDSSKRSLDSPGEISRAKWLWEHNCLRPLRLDPPSVSADKNMGKRSRQEYFVHRSDATALAQPSIDNHQVRSVEASGSHGISLVAGRLTYLMPHPGKKFSEQHADYCIVLDYEDAK